MNNKLKRVEILLWAALERLEASDPPKGGRTDKVCKRIRRYLSETYRSPKPGRST